MQAYGNSTIRVFGLWDIIGDHTNAANVDSGNFATPYGTNGGYMAVVNAAYGINNAVQKTVTGLCTDTYYEFTSWFKNICIGCSCDTSGRGVSSAQFKNYKPGPKNLDDSAGVTPDLTFQVDGVDYYTTGSIPYNKRWMKKGFLFRTNSSQTSAVLTIRNNAPGGGGNDWVMDDINLGTCLPTLELRPGPNPSYCLNAQIDLSVIVTSFYNNYTFYEWERSTDGGVTWTSAPEMPGVRNYSYNYTAGVYKDTVALPSFLSEATKNGWKYRVKTATSSVNLNNNGCSVYNSAEVFTLDIKSSCDILPIDLLNFSAVINEEHGVLNWTAKNENNLAVYEIEKSLDGVQFEKIGTVTVKGGVESNYNFRDPDALSGKAYYRLKMIAAAGNTFKYSNILQLSIRGLKNFELLNVVNPFREELRFQVSAPQNETVELRLMDVAGRCVKQEKLSLRKGINTHAFPVSASLQKGTYILSITTSTGKLSQVLQVK